MLDVSSWKAIMETLNWVSRELGPVKCNGTPIYWVQSRLRSWPQEAVWNMTVFRHLKTRFELDKVNENRNQKAVDHARLGMLRPKDIFIQASFFGINEALPQVNGVPSAIP